jgi:predicted XRE-type DNA-binding protein
VAKKPLSTKDSRELEELTKHIREVLINQWVNTKGMSLRRFAERAHLSEMTVRNFMRWKTQRPHVQTLVQIAHALEQRHAVVPAAARVQPDELRVDQGAGLKPTRRRR